MNFGLKKVYVLNGMYFVNKIAFILKNFQKMFVQDGTLLTK